MIQLVLFCLAALINSQMDTFKDKWEFYASTFYPKIASFLVKIKLFKNQEQADLWFNSTGDSWRNAYIDRIKDNSKPNQNKIQYNILGFKFNKPAPLVDAWHYFKLLLIICICTIVAINLPIYFILFNEAITRILYVFMLSIVWGILFGISYNKS